MATFEIAKLLNKIKDDIPGINAVVKALAKWDVSAFTDVPEGAMQATVDTEKRLTFKRLLSGTWAPIGKIMHDVDTVDGYHASASATPNALAVRDNNGALPGNILGNAATATESEKLSAGAVVPVNQGGTGATTSSGARANLGAASGADFTAHENLVAYPSIAGHVMLDSYADNGLPIAMGRDSALKRLVKYFGAQDTEDGTKTIESTFLIEGVKVGLPDETFLYIMQLFYSRVQADSNRVQIAFGYNTLSFYTRRYYNGNFSDWSRKPTGISDSVSSVSPVFAASSMAVKTAYDRGSAAYARADAAYDLAALPAKYVERRDIAEGGYANVVYSTAARTGYRVATILVKNNIGSNSILIGAHDENDSPPYGLTISNTNGVGRISGTGLPEAGDVVFSGASSKSGHLLCNGAPVSRTTYSALFEIIGTTYGAGNGSTTFNLPDARNKTLWGASGNLGAVLEAGLPNIIGGLLYISNHNSSAGGTGTGAFSETSYVAGGGDGNFQSHRSYNFNASRSSAIYGKSTTVQPPSLALNVFIKY